MTKTLKIIYIMLVFDTSLMLMLKSVLGPIKYALFLTHFHIYQSRILNQYSLQSLQTCVHLQFMPIKKIFKVK